MNCAEHSQGDHRLQHLEEEVTQRKAQEICMNPHRSVVQRLVGQQQVKLQEAVQRRTDWNLHPTDLEFLQRCEMAKFQPPV